MPRSGVRPPARAGCLSGCSSGGGNPTLTFSDSVAGSPGSGPNGGAGGDASGLPAFTGMGCTGTECADAGPGGGGGGGYFGGGGGATGYDACFATATSPPSSGPCNDAGPGQGGAGGSSFAANAVQFPRAPGVLGNTGDQFIKFVPVIEIDAPANGAVYAPGQSVSASWSCGYDGATGLGPGNNCSGTVASGSPIDMSPGTHTFTVAGKVNNNAGQVLSATVTYTVGTSGATRSAQRSSSGVTFTLSAPSACVSPGGKLQVTLATRGASQRYRAVSYGYYVGAGVAVRKHVIRHGRHRVIVVNIPNLSVHGPGAATVPLGTAGAGAHTLRLVIGLRATGHRKPRTKTVTVPISFTVC